MRCIRCKGWNMVYVGKDTYHCPDCGMVKTESQLTESVRRQTPYERTRAAVYATGNKWAIENFEATH